jgi:IS5 family transposase
MDVLTQKKLRATIQAGNRLLGQVMQVMHQSRERFKGIHVPNKLYSYHEPQVTVICKGKGSKPREYGCKVNLSIDKNGYVVNHQEYTKNRHDAKLLEPALKDWENDTWQLPKQLNVDRGYRQKEKQKTRRFKNISQVCIPACGKSSQPNKHKAWFKKGMSSRAGIEAVIGHLKQDHRMNKSRYQGFTGDKINVSWAILAWNTKKWMKATTSLIPVQN